MKQHNDPYYPPSDRMIALGCLLMILVMIIGCFGWFLIPELGTRWTIFNAENRVNDISQRVRGMAVATDLSLQGEAKPTTQLGGTLRCVYTEAYLTYGTNEPYDKIIDGYKGEFNKLGWQSTPIPNDERKGVAFFPAKDRTLVVIVSRSKTTSAAFQTIYDVIFDYDQCSEFCPEWRCPRK